MNRGRLADLQARQVEVGRIRMGTTETKTSAQGREYQSPVKLERFRLTSRSQQLIEEAAALYGGTPEPWTPQNGGATQFEVIVESRSLPIIVPPDSLSQFYEVWAGGKVKRRCDGIRELLSDQACLCAQANPDPARRQCKPYTRLSVMLADMNGVGVWRLETHGYNAAVELPAVADLLSRLGHVQARLELEERSAIVEVNGKEQTSRFMVPVIHVESTPAAIVGAVGPRQALEAAPTQDPPALEQAPMTPTPVAPDGPSEEETKRHWALFTELNDKLLAATTRNQMMYLRQEIAQAPLPPGFLAELTEKWNTRAKAMAAATATAARAPSPETSATAPNTVQATAATTPTPVTPTLDRGQVWMAIQTWGGYNNVTTSQLAMRFQAWGKGGDDIRQASAEVLEQFRVWLAAGGN